MTSYNPGTSFQKDLESTGNQPVTKSATGSSPPPATAVKGHARTEHPKEPDHIYHAFDKYLTDAVPIGNPAYELMHVTEGRLGLFLDRKNTNPHFNFCPLYTDAYWYGAHYTIRDAMRRLIKNKGYIEAADIETRCIDIAATLADGVFIMTYLKLRSVNSFEVSEMSKFVKKPKVPTPFEVPTPFALAISQLGIFKVSSLTKELILSPTFPGGAITSYGLPAHRSWSATKYAQAEEYAKSLGMSFSKVDLKVKLGSSWWLYKQDNEDDFFSLQCILPEDNYTETTAAIATLFCADGAGNLSNEFVNLSGLEQDVYGSMLRNPPADINVSSFFAIEDTPETIWKVV